MKTMTTGQVAEALGVSRSTVRRWIESGRLEARRYGKRDWQRVDVDALVEFLRERGTPIPIDLKSE